MGFVRVVGGALRGRKLQVLDRGVRPTSERTREAIFDILGPATVAGARVLDLYAGTGALGTEALSRGARSTDFVEVDRAVARRLEESLAELGLAEVARVHVGDLDRGLPAGIRGPWELVFLDPPYDGDAGARWVEAAARGGLLGAEGILVYERRKGSDAPTPAGLTLRTDRIYGDTAVAFYRADVPEGRPGQGGL
ncbi:MAG TPA: 16S rRNA (guanine(966)-N(2))-methyltransferase RsmD [Candidatus Eisenbacteria bacterium]|nr:16S rRNA (guanine(966)-N(2))-methyltransferase RsmD [Candidatus Eisenbacteria bacterium]